ncbi:MAG: alpha/beta fold hydrolase [Acidimicrobiales bacterium]
MNDANQPLEPNGPVDTDHGHHLRDLADVDADTIVLVPGLDGTAELFYRQIAPLARRFNVVAFPLPDRRRASMDDLVDDLALLVTEVSRSGAILCGESFGGALSMSLALRYPELVKGLVIINSFPYLSNRFELAVAPWLIKIVPWAAMPAVRRFTEHRLHSAHTLPEDLQQFRTRMRKIKRDGYIRRLEILAHYDLRGSLGEIEVPVLFLAGTDDKLLPSAHWAEYMGRRVPNSDVRLLPGYGHCCLINHDLDLGEIVGPWWLDQVSSGVGEL